MFGRIKVIDIVGGCADRVGGFTHKFEKMRDPQLTSSARQKANKTNRGNSYRNGVNLFSSNRAINGYLERHLLMQTVGKLGFPSLQLELYNRRKESVPRLLSTVLPASSEGREIIEEAWRLVEEAKNEVIFDPKYREAILVVGNTGTGKSTLVQFIAGDMSKMWAVEFPKYSGNFIIQDEDGKISKPGEESTSTTLYPELVVSTAKDMAFYDNPGFKDSRGTAIDMAAAYMTKMVFENSEKIKVHITVEWETAIGQSGRGAPFVEAIERVGEFIHNAVKFKDAFSMVATKVPKVTREDEEGNDIVVPDEILIESVGDFIVRNMIPDVKKKLEAETNEKKKQILENALVIFTALSQSTNGAYSRIGLFRRPQKEGSLDKSPLMQKSRGGIMAAIKDETAFTAVSKDDFGMSIADNTKLEMMEISEEINTDIKSNMQEIGTSIITNVHKQMRESGDWIELSDSLTVIQQIVVTNAQQLKSLEKLTLDFVETMEFDLTSVDVAVSAIKFQALKDDISYLDFLEVMIEKNLGSVPVTALDDSATFIAQALAWYKIQYQIMDALSTDSIQEDTTKYNVANLDDWGQPNKPQGLRVSKLTFPQFAKLLQIDTPAIDGFDLNEERMNELNSIVKLTLDSKPDIKVKPDGTLLAQGPFIRVSKVFEEYKKNESKVKVFTVNASCAVYVDTPTLTAPGCHMIIAAPTWHIIGSPTINLDGKSGESKSTPAEDGKGETPGEDGVPGGAGQPAGHFIGVADKVLNPKQLTILANGGNGGSGQEGGKGGSGTNGTDASYPSDKWQSTPYGEEGRDWKELWYDRTEKIFWSLLEWHYDIYAKAASDGKNGGDGGVGGFGGYNGNVNLTVFEGTSAGWPTVRNSEGKVGGKGAGGQGGDKARHGDDMKAYRWLTRNSFGKIDAEWSRLNWYNKGDSSVGASGNEGGNENGREEKIPQQPISMINTFLIDFKGYILGIAANSPLLRHSLEQLLRNMVETSGLSELYNVSAFLYEMNTLESLFYAIHKRMNVTPYYNSFLNRVRQYADDEKDRTAQVEKLALATVYTSCLGKICSLQLEYKAQTFIIDLSAYIDITLRRVNELVEMDRREAIKGFQKSYNQTIELKVKEANQLIKDKVNPAIDKSMRAMDDVLDNLVEETLEKLEEAETTVEELQELQAQMEKNVLIRGILNLVSLGGTIAGLCGPIGAAVGSVVTGGATIIGSLVVDTDVPGGSPILLPPGVESTIKGFGDLVNGLRDKKIKELEAQLALTQKEIEGKPAEEKEDLKDLEQKVKELQQKLEAEKNTTVPEDDEDAIAAQTERIGKLQTDLTETLKKKENQLKEEIAAGNKGKEKVLAGVKKINNGVKVISASLDTYNKFKNDQKKLDAISDALREADQAVMALQEYERNIYALLFPMVRNMRDDMNEVLASLSGKSQVALDVTKWEVQSALNGIKSTLELAMNGFDAQAEMTACFDQLNEALTLLIHIYDRLENYHDQQALGDYIANVGAVGDYKDLLRGTEYEEGVRMLDMTIQSNLVLLEYENSMHAFKQWVFPFARTYLESSTLPESLKPVQDEVSLRELVVMADKQLNEIKDHITRYWATIPAHEKFFFAAKFYSNEKLGGPFYMWTKEHHKKEIQDLFKGNEITLLADVRKSQQFVTYRRAIKFALVYLRFLLDGDDEERKAKFEDVLEYFMVNMVYTGVSYYEFQDQIYFIAGDPITLSYSIKRDSKGDPDIESTSRDKLLSGDLLLSPYGLWTIKLSADRKEAFDLIKEFVDDVTLELSGSGKYIYDPQDELAALDLRPHEFYQVDGSLKYQDTLLKWNVGKKNSFAH